MEGDTITWVATLSTSVVSSTTTSLVKAGLQLLGSWVSVCVCVWSVEKRAWLPWQLQVTKTLDPMPIYLILKCWHIVYWQWQLIYISLTIHQFPFCHTLLKIELYNYVSGSCLPVQHVCVWRKEVSFTYIDEPADKNHYTYVFFIILASVFIFVFVSYTSEHFTWDMLFIVVSESYFIWEKNKMVQRGYEEKKNWLS